jgi:hypothetical protein
LAPAIILPSGQLFDGTSDLPVTSLSLGYHPRVRVLTGTSYKAGEFPSVREGDNLVDMNRVVGWMKSDDARHSRYLPAVFSVSGTAERPPLCSPWRPNPLPSSHSFRCLWPFSMPGHTGGTRRYLRIGRVTWLIIVRPLASMSLEGYPYRKRTKQIEIAYHFVCDEVASGEIAVLYIQIEDMIADILAKPLPPLKHAKHVQTMNLLQLPSRITESQE